MHIACHVRSCKQGSQSDPFLMTVAAGVFSAWAALRGNQRLLSVLRHASTLAAPSEGHVTQISQMLRELVGEESKEERLSRAMRICAFTKQHSIKPWLLGEKMKDFYQTLSSTAANDSVAGIIGLLKCLHPRDPFVESLAKTLTWRKNELDFHDCIYLVHLSIQNPRLVAILTPIHALLRGHLVRLMTEGAELSGPELERSISLLTTVRHFSRGTFEMVLAYLTNHLHRIDVDSVQSVLLQVAGATKLHSGRCNPAFMGAVSTYFLEILHKSSDVEDRAAKWGRSYGLCFSKFLRFYGDVKFYDERVCEKIKEVFLGPFDCHIHNPIFMSNLAYMCERVFYYDEDLLEYILQLSYNQAESFHTTELKDTLLAFQNLNYSHQVFLDRVTEVTLRSSNTAHSRDLYWGIISSSIFMNRYSSEVLERFLTDSMMEGSIKEGKFISHIYLKMLIGLAVENPHLALGTQVSEQALKFGQVPYHLSALSDRYAQFSLQSMLNSYKKKAFSMFGSNFHRALMEVVGNGCFRSEPLSLAGYNMDFEVLFGADGGPIPVMPSCVLLNSAFRSIGLVAAPESSPVVLRPSKMSLLLDTLGASEAGGNVSGEDPFDGARQTSKANYVRVASDWARYFAPLGSRSEVTRKVVFELNGPIHYASNASARGHIRGKDVVKRRQLEALGWQVVHVPHYEWNSLATGDDHIKYVKYIINKLQ